MYCSRTSSIKVKQPAQSVWEIISDTKKYSGIEMPGVFAGMDLSTAEKGALIRRRDKESRQTEYMYLIDMKPKSTISFGATPEDWTYKYELVEGKDGTEVRYSRKYGKYNPLKKLGISIKRLFSKDNLQAETDKTIAAIESACQSIADTGKDHIVIDDHWFGNQAR